MKGMERILKMKCSDCGYWNRVPVNKIFLEQHTSEPKVKAYIPMYEPLETSKCKSCGKIIAELKELIKIVHTPPFTYISYISFITKFDMFSSF